MGDEKKTNAQLMGELAELHAQLAVFRAVDAERRAAEEALHEKLITEKAILDNIPDMAWLKDKEGRFVAVNEPFARASGIPREALVGKTDFDFWPHGLARRFVNDDAEVMKSGKRKVIEEIRARSGAETRWIETIKSPISNEEGEIIGITGISRDITERKRAEAEREKLIAELMSAREALEFQATHDGLTKLWNRSAILEKLELELARAVRERHPVSVIMADLDHFKKVNDTYGHMAGDSVLRETARRISSCVRPYDLVGRYGGEELLVLVPACTAEEAVNVAERILDAVSREDVETEYGTIHITVSVGVAVASSPAADDTGRIVRAADKAMYKAKEAGRNCVRVAREQAGCGNR